MHLIPYLPLLEKYKQITDYLVHKLPDCKLLWNQMLNTSRKKNKNNLSACLLSLNILSGKASSKPILLHIKFWTRYINPFNKHSLTTSLCQSSLETEDIKQANIPDLVEFIFYRNERDNRKNKSVQ